MVKLFVYGSTGDLVKNKVLPALQSFKNLEIFALGRREIIDDEYHGLACKPDVNRSFCKSIKYVLVDFDRNFCDKCFNHLDKEKVNYFYVALPPKTVNTVLKQIADIKNQGYKVRVLLEKPFGEDLKSALKLRDLISEFNLTEELFIVDHYLFKKEILDLKKQNFEKFYMKATETNDVKNRVSYYEGIGALRDMIQSHFLNVLFRIFNEDINPEDIETLEFEKAQYKDYEKELSKKSDTETFVYWKFKIKEKEITFVTGKALDKKETLIEIDNKKLKIQNKENPYVGVFENFLAGKKENFPTIEQSILAWKILEKIPENTKLKKYEKTSNPQNLIS
jgi:glucose-6-phosphate 1-dehydrogenase